MSRAHIRAFQPNPLPLSSPLPPKKEKTVSEIMRNEDVNMQK